MHACGLCSRRVQCWGRDETQPDPALQPLLLGRAWAKHSPAWGSMGAGPPRRRDLSTVKGAARGPLLLWGSPSPPLPPRPPLAGDPTPLPLSEPLPGLAMASRAPSEFTAELGTLAFHILRSRNPQW